MKLRNCAIGFAILLGGCAIALKAYKTFLDKQRDEANSDISVTSIDTNSLSDSDSDSSVASLSDSLSSLDSFASSAENNVSRSPSYSASASAVQSDLDSKNSDFDSLNHLSKNRPSLSSSATSQSTSSQSDSEHDDSDDIFMDGLQGVEKPSFDAPYDKSLASIVNNLSAFDDDSEQAKSSSEPDSLRSLSNDVSSTKDEVDSLSHSSDNTRNSTSYSVSVNKNGKPRITLKDRGQDNNNLFGNVCSDHIIDKLGSDYLKGLKEIANKQFKHISTSELEKIFHLDYYHAQFLTYRLWRFYVINSHSNTYSPKGENDLDPLNLIQYIDCIESNQN